MAPCPTSDVRLPEEMALQCLTWLPGSHAHFVISTCCRSFKTVAKDDDMWVGRLMRDFPRCRLQDKARGTLHMTYRILAKAHQRHFKTKCTSQPVVQERSELWWQLMAARPEPQASPPQKTIRRWRSLLGSALKILRDTSAAEPALGAHVAVCDGCSQCPIVGERHKCNICPDYDLCRSCYMRRHELHSVHDEWIPMEADISNSSVIQPSSWTLHASSGMVLTRAEVEHHVRELRASRRQEPTQVAAALEAQGGGVPRVIAMIERSLAPVDLPACTFESIGTGSRKYSQQVAQNHSSHASNIDAEPKTLEEGYCPQGDQQSSFPAIENITHFDQAAEIDEQMAGSFVVVQHDDIIERNLGRSSADDIDTEVAQEQDLSCSTANRDQRW